MFSSNATQVSSDAAYIEDVFSTWLYTGNGSTQTITNGIDLAGKGGLVWVKKRDSATVNASHYLVDTARGAGNYLRSDSTGASSFDSQISAFNSNGFFIGSDGANVNLSGSTYASWTFRKQPKFFDIVTFTAPAVGVVATISHSLGSVPGCIIMKSTTNASNWIVLHRYDQTMFGELNTTSAFQSSGFNANFTSTSFEVRGGFNINANSGTYVAYLFAHNAGGFGATGADNVISCGSYTTDGSGAATVNLGYEPQWLMVKTTSEAGNWQIYDVMRGFAVGGPDQLLRANLSNAEQSITTFGSPTATGFEIESGASNPGSTFIYIAIRRGPMRTPTTGTSVFAMDTYRATSPALQSGFVVDMFFNRSKSSSGNWDQGARLIGANYLRFNTTNVEATAVDYTYDYQNGVRLSGGTAFPDFQGWMLRRAPGFFDVVCFRSNSLAGATFSHNLGVVPELLIVKSRGTTGDWYVYGLAVGGNSAGQWYMKLNLVDALTGYTALTANTASSVTISNGSLNATNATQVAYLFASCPGVSRVGSFTGTGSTQIINCGFSAGARFVLIKRTDSTGDWYVWDSARGIVAGNDPYLLLNSTAAEVTNTDWVDTAASGFELSNAGGNLVNINGASYIFLSVA